MKKLLFILITLTSTVTFSQVINNEVYTGQAKHANLPLVDLNTRLQDNSDAVNYQGYYLANTTLEEVKGSPFPFDNATIIINTIDGKSYKVPNGNYNAKSNEIVSNFVTDSSFVFQSNSIKSVQFDKYTAKPYTDKESNSSFYFQLTPHADIKLLKKYVAKIVDGQINVLTKQKTSADWYNIIESYSYSIDGETAQPIKLKKKNILKVLSNKKKLIQKFVDDNDLSYKDEKDVIKMFNYYSFN